MPPPEVDPHPIGHYCDQALADAMRYRLVQLGHYTARQLDDPDEVPWDFAVALLRADGAFHAAKAEAQRRAMPAS